MRQVLHRVVLIVAFLMVLSMVTKVTCPDAAASYGLGDTLETVGIATGIGAVIGLSTIAFYDKPASHFRNALIGAGAGMIVGMGVAAYLFTNSSEDDEIDPEELLPPEKKEDAGKQSDIDHMPARMLAYSGNKAKKTIRKSFKKSFASVPVALILPTRTQQWAVAVRVLELGF